MAEWMQHLKLVFMRGHIILLRAVNSVYDALLVSWHRDWVMVYISLLLALASIVLMIASLWFISSSIAFTLHNSLDAAAGDMLRSIVAAGLAFANIKVAHWLLPLGEKEDTE